MRIDSRTARLGCAIGAMFLAAAAGARAGAAVVTFNKDIAPVVFADCAGWHRPGGVGPFELLTYADVRRHLPVVLRTVRDRVMPPWLPEPGFGEFAEDRRLDERTMALVQAWADQGAAEGEAADLPKPPAPPPEW